MKVAILGTRGIPASYSGFETAAEQLASRLAARGRDRAALVCWRGSARAHGVA